MNNKKWTQSIISLLVAFIMIFSCIPVYADRDTQTGGGGGSGGTGGSWSVTTKTGGEEFIRCSIWFYKDGINVDKNPTPVGYAIDLRSPKYASLRSGTPVRFSEAKDNQNTARHYNFDKGDFQPGSHYYGAVMENAVPGETKEEYEANKGNATLEFPIIATADRNIEATGVDSDAYFRHFDVYNKLLWYVQANKYGDAASSGGEWQDVSNMENGIYVNSLGESLSGQYIILLESGVYCSINGTSAALTLRDMISLHTGPGGLLSQFADPPRNCANALYIVKDWSDSLGLNGESGENQITGHVRDNLELCKAKLGANIITFEPGEGQIPVINYYYDFSSGVPGGSSLEEAKNPYTPILSEDTKAFDTRAYSEKRVEVRGNEYKAPLISKPSEGAQDFVLVMGYMGLKDDLDGSLDIKDDDVLKFYDKVNTAQISDKCKVYTKSQITTEDDVNIWNKSKHMVSSIDKNVELTGISEKLIQKDGDSLKAVYGKSKNKYQAVFLYVKLPDLISNPPGGPGGTPKGTIPKTPDPGKNEEVLDTPTNVTIMYFEKENDTSPKKIETDSFPRSSTYNVVKTKTMESDNYEMKQWVIVNDKNPGVPEDITTWDKVREEKSNEDVYGEGDTPGGLGPSHWKDPDRELFIKYIKKIDPPVATGKINHLLTEKRITKRYTLLQNYKIPKFEWSWPFAGNKHTEEPHEECKTGPHKCNQSVSEPRLNFVLSNLLKVNEQVMGNQTYFKPYDMNNVKTLNRGVGEGSDYIQGSDYGYVVWRGRDIPTIALYKYDGSTEQNTAENKETYKMAINLVPEGKIPMETRHKENGHDGGQGYYQDGFEVKYGEAKKDTGLTGNGIVEKSNIGDYEWSDRWSYINHGSAHQVRREEPEERPIKIEGGVKVDVGQSTEIQGLNNRTNIVTNYINFIDRNIGNDTSISD